MPSKPVTKGKAAVKQTAAQKKKQAHRNAKDNTQRQEETAFFKKLEARYKKMSVGKSVEGNHSRKARLLIVAMSEAKWKKKILRKLKQVKQIIKDSESVDPALGMSQIASTLFDDGSTESETEDDEEGEGEAGEAGEEEAEGGEEDGAEVGMVEGDGDVEGDEDVENKK